ncbi:uncharacterized protein LOC111716856 [Eurytemora carolleeae]|uniref:uncharacterized protein LOC111716856 n=1 Tax=Eurytemora carolleeae TaxID=1294199 RepID=UPI000C7777F4|nr:uncharacterized protein LOC111716856 [Eurytemora carolleeae]|eukprot:XP_023348131.1 uncharacterized protein LOC111716856 [Eurytemora affinis]
MSTCLNSETSGDNRKKRKKLTTFEISQLIENEGIFGDDSDLDPDYMEPEFDPSSESSGEEWQRDNGKQDKVVRPGKRLAAVPETRVYMDPPIELPEANTDNDSGK